MDWKGKVYPSVRKEYPRSSIKTRKIAAFYAFATPSAGADFPLGKFSPRNVQGCTGAGKGPGMVKAFKAKRGLLSHKVAIKILTHLYFPANAPEFSQIGNC